MKILDIMEAKRLKRVPEINRFAKVNATYEALPSPDIPYHWQWKIGFDVYSVFTGPERSDDHMSHLFENARRLVAREVFGELTDDLFELLRTLSEEGYRPEDDKAMQIINKLISKTRGE